MKEIDYDNRCDESSLTCPHCGKTAGDAYDEAQIFGDSEEAEDVKCKGCGKTYKAERETTYNFVSYPYLEPKSPKGSP